jgi:DNA modification methylase
VDRSHIHPVRPVAGQGGCHSRCGPYNRRLIAILFLSGRRLMENETALQRMLNTIQHGDCVAGINGLPAGCMDLAFADPPFNIGYEYDVYDDRKEREHYLDWSRQWVSAVHRVLKPSGTFWLAIGDEYAAELKLLSQEIGFHCRSWVIWYYTFGVNCKKKFSRSHVHLFHFVKDPKEFTFRAGERENRILSARQLVYNDNRANPHGRLADDTWILRPQDMVDCFTPGEDTWYFPRVAGTFKEREGFHGCQMPEQLLGRIIRLCSREDERVLDPFAGSATTLVVAQKLGRFYLGFELSEEYVSRGRDRLSRSRRGDELDGSPEPLVSAPSTPRGRTGSRVKAAASGTALRSANQGTAAATSRSDDLPPTEAASSLLERGLVDAFRRVYDGYSLDRVIADPTLNAQLAAACRLLGLPGDPRTWNRLLFNFRKAGKLVQMRTEKRTEIGWEECDAYLFASEIALAQMSNDGYGSLDQILCDPDLARKFDEIASSFAPGFTSLEYRWAALKLRKEAKFARSRSENKKVPVHLNKCVPVTEIDWTTVPDVGGVYRLTGGLSGKTVDLYVGESLNLRERLRLQFREAAQLRAWHGRTLATDFCVATSVIEGGIPELLAYESRLIRRYNPLLNLKELGKELNAA